MSVPPSVSFFLTWKPDPSRLTRPLYLALANALEADISTGALSAGTRLPSQRDLADALGINFTTVTRAYDLCREKGLIYGVVGRGSFVAPGRGAAGSGDAMLELGIVNGFDQVQAPVVEATRAVLGKGYLERLYTYAEPAGHPHQRAAGAQWMARTGVRTDAEHTMVFAGAQNIISTALVSLFKLGDRIAVDEYTYVNLIGAAKLFHLRLVPVRGDADGMLPDALADRCRAERVTGLFLMPGCANPTTVSMPEARRDAIAEIARRYDLTVLEDDIVGGLPAFAGSVPMQARLPERTVFISGSTKCLCSGLRVAFAAIPERFLAAMKHGLLHLNIKTSSLDAEIMTELVLSGRAARVLERKQLLAQAANRLFEETFPDAGRGRPGLFRRLDLPADGRSGPAVEAELAALGVRAFHAYRFQAGRDAGRAFLRLSLSSENSAARLAEALGRVRRWRDGAAG